MLSFAFQFSIYFQLHLISFFHFLLHFFSLLYILRLDMNMYSYFHLYAIKSALPTLYILQTIYIQEILFHFYTSAKLKIWLFSIAGKETTGQMDVFTQMEMHMSWACELVS